MYHVRLHRRQAWALIAALLVIAALALVAAGCGSSTTTDSSTTVASPAASPAATIAPYDGVDAQYFGELAEPEVKSGFTWKAGFLQPVGFVPDLVAWQQAFVDKAKELGGTVTVNDAGLDIQKQVSQFNQMVTAGNDVISGHPMFAPSVTQSLKNAKAAGIPVVFGFTPADVSQPLPANVAMNVGPALDYAAFTAMAYVAQQMPGAKVAVMGFAQPNDFVNYLTDRQSYWAAQDGLEVLGQVDAKEDTAAGYSAAATSLIAKYPDAQVIVTYNDPSAIATLTSLKASGKADVKVATGGGGEALAQTALKDGSMLCSYQIPWRAMGDQMAIAVYNILTDQGQPLPEILNIKSELATKDNVDQFEMIK
jgi:ribose transport system substrate-binding protein